MVILLANASAKPASDASTDGVTSTTNPVTPMTTLDKRLNRTLSHRLTTMTMKGDDLKVTISDVPPHIQKYGFAF